MPPRTPDSRVLGRKACRTCGLEKDAPAEFTPARRGRLHCTNQCRTCRNAALRAKAAANPRPRAPLKPWEPRFWAKVRKTDTCWWWTGAQNGQGYGHLRFGPVTHYAHRLALRMAGREPMAGQHVDHLCRNPTCVRPDHLEAVTPAENARRGLKAKLKKAHILEMRRMFARGVSPMDVAAAFGIPRNNVYSIRGGKRWAADMTEASP